MRRPTNATERLQARYIPAGYQLARQDGTTAAYISPDGLIAITFWGSSMKSTDHLIHRTPASCQETIDRFFKNWESHKAFQQERKANRIRGETDTQKVKKALRAAGYPVTSVTRGSGTSSHWIEIVIDDYESAPDQDGRMRSKSPDVMTIAKLASGRENLHDDIQSDYFIVDISITFSKHHRCQECIVSNCDRYHTPDSCVCGNFHNTEMAERERAYWKAYEQQQAREQADREEREDSPEAIQAAIEKEDLRIAEEYRKNCEKVREELGHPWVYDGAGGRDNVVGPSGTPAEKPGWRVKEIQLDLDHPRLSYFDSFQSASAHLRSISDQFPATGGYDKINFKVVFCDGEEYAGRLDCKAASCPDNDLDVFDHIYQFTEYMSGRASNPHNGMEEYRAYLLNFPAEQIKSYGDFIDKYLLPNMHQAGRPADQEQPGVPA